MWKQEKHRYIYDPFCKEINFNDRRPTDYKLNKRTKLPKPLDLEGEFMCEIRKRSIFKAYEKYKSLSLRGNKLRKNGGSKNHQDGSNGDMKEILNLNPNEKKGLKSLLKRVKDDEIVITPTDKSGRFAVLSLEQYVKAGNKHTDKDELITWSRLKYLRNQVNSHVWWISRIMGYSKNTDEDRMNNNLHVSGLDVPEMAILIKDHKKWSKGSGEVVPSRPVVSGNNTINTHLSEIISEIVEPLALESDGMEINSSEEALGLIDRLNTRVKAGTNSENVLSQLYSQDKMADNMAAVTCSMNNEIFNVSDLSSTGIEGQENQLLSLSEETSLLETLDSLIRSGHTGDNWAGNVSDEKVLDRTENINIERVTEPTNNTSMKKKSKMTDYFIVDQKRDTCRDSAEWSKMVSETARKNYEREKNTLNDRISEGAKSGRLWALSNELIKQRSTGEDYKHSCEAPTLQDTEAKPILFGGDVVGLYPNMDPISVAQITADAVRKTRVKFKGINVQLLAVYLVLVLGQSELCKRGLGDIVPRRKHKSNSTSLAGTLNRDLGNWDFTGIEFTYEKVVEMIASMVQTSVLVMTTTTCYKFAGRIYRQRYGLGIGLRGSAALARLCMCYWDKLWGKLMLDNGLSLELFFRYVDDLRIYLRPIRKCWTWMNNKWVFNEKECTKGDHQWTMEQLKESMNGIWTFLEFTVEGEQDFSDSWLPTLDFKTQVAHDGTIKYLFYSKPMASNIVLEKGAALSKGTVFSSLRQELVRRLLNTDISLGPETRVNLTCDFIQNMVNSNHKFPYIKSVTLQALTKFNHMVQRSKCTPDQKRYAPLHRTRDHNEKWRKLAKYTNGALWYTGEKLVDKFANSWKSWIKRKKGPYSQRKKLNKKGRLFHSTFGGEVVLQLAILVTRKRK